MCQVAGFNTVVHHYQLVVVPNRFLNVFATRCLLLYVPTELISFIELLAQCSWMFLMPWWWGIVVLLFALLGGDG